jgi:hypothetical protein
MKAPSPSKPSEPQPVELARWNYWCLATTIALEAAWIVVLVVLAVKR